MVARSTKNLSCDFCLAFQKLCFWRELGLRHLRSQIFTRPVVNLDLVVKDALLDYGNAVYSRSGLGDSCVITTGFVPFTILQLT